jgi:hypothetical protein
MLDMPELSSGRLRGEHMFKYELGTEVKDKITGLKGIIVAKTEWLYGCIRYVVQPQQLHEGKPVESSSFDEDQIEVVAAPKKQATTSRGGPKPPTARGLEVKRG